MSKDDDFTVDADDLTAKSAEDLTVKSADVISLYKQEPWKVVFRNDKHEDVGVLKFDEEGKLHFDGSVEDSARIFFNAVIAVNNNRIRLFIFVKQDDFTAVLPS